MTTGSAAIVVLFCFFGHASGRALAHNWRPAWQAVLYGLLLSAGARITALILFARPIRDPLGELIEFSLLALVIAGITTVSFRFTLAQKMSSQYPWLYERHGLFGWREKRALVTPGDRG